MPRVKPLALAATVVVWMCVASASAAHAAQARSPSCASLRGKRLAGSRAIKVVEHADEARAAVFACVPPRGRVHLLGVARDTGFGGAEEASVVALAGTWLAVEFRNQIGAHTYEQIGKTCDAASGRCYRFFAEGFPEPSLEAEVPELRFSLQRVVIDNVGQSAAAVANYNTVQIVGFGSGGAQRTLDSGPSVAIGPASLQFEGHTVRWIDAGMPRSAAP